MALSPSQRDALTRAKATLRLETRTRVVNYALALWGPRGAINDADAKRFVQRVAPVVQAGQRRVITVTAAYVAQVTGTNPAPHIELNELRGGTLIDDVYMRPTVTMRDKLSNGKSFDVALAAATARLANLVETDIQLAMTHQSRASVSAAGNGWGFRRVLSGAENCELCSIASENTYHSGDLMPIHPHCDCGVEPVQGASEPLDFSGTAVIVHEHGEYGPTLAWRKDDFTGPSDI